MGLIDEKTLTEACEALGLRAADEEQLRREFAWKPPADLPWTGDVPKMRTWVGTPTDVVILVHPAEGESVVDALRRHLEPMGMGTVTVHLPGGRRELDMPAEMAGVAVIETTVVPPGEVRVVPRDTWENPIVTTGPVLV